MLRYDIPAADGKRRQKTETVRGTRRDAERVLAQRLQQLNSGAFVAPSTLTFAELADRFLVARSSQVTETTHDLYKRNLRTHILPRIGNLRINQIQQHDIEDVLARSVDNSRTQRRGQRLSGGTLRNILITIRACLQYAVRNEWIARNVAQRVSLPVVNDREPVLFHPRVVQGISDAVAGEEVEAPVLFALGTGARRGEICGLQWGDIDLPHSRFTIRRSAVNLRGAVVYRHPKTKASRRTDVFAPSVAAMLKRHRTSFANSRKALGLTAVNDASFVFTRADGSPWDPNELSRMFSRLVRRKHIGPLRFHDLRHGHASIAFAAGVPLQIISESMGHSSVVITSRIYVHLLEEGRHEKAALFDRYLRKMLRAQRTPC